MLRRRVDIASSRSVVLQTPEADQFAGLAFSRYLKPLLPERANKPLDEEHFDYPQNANDTRVAALSFDLPRVDPFHFGNARSTVSTFERNARRAKYWVNGDTVMIATKINSGLSASDQRIVFIANSLSLRLRPLSNWCLPLLPIC
jgi:hypothetical protein